MKKTIARSIVLALILLLALPATIAAGPPSTATVHFGRENVGSPFGPEHDQSFHAVDAMVPRTVVISRGGSVTYEISPLHQVAIYGPGTKPDDIVLSPDTLDDLVLPPIPGFPPVIRDIIINYDVGRVALSPPLDFFAHQEWMTPAGTFDEPGRYLVICTTLPHFAEADMYGWVIVK